MNKTGNKMKNENLVIGIIVLALILVFFGGFGMMGWGGYGMMGMYNYGYSGMWLFGWLYMILIVVALILLIAWLIKQLRK